MLGWNDSPGDLLSWDVTTPDESFCTGMERLQGSPSIPGQKDSRGVIPSQDRRTPVEKFCPGMEQLLGVILSWD